MFEIGQNVVSKNSGVCKIVDKERKDFGIGEQMYFILEPCFRADSALSKVYIPEKSAETQLRYVMEKQEVLSLIGTLSSLERLWYADPKIRRQKFEEIYKSGNIQKICQLIKSLYLQNEEMKKLKKTLSMLDRDFLDKLQKDINEEFAIALDMDLAEVPSFINRQMQTQ